MNFYDEWKRTRSIGHSDMQFLQAYLDNDPDSVILLQDGEKEEIVTAIKVLLDIPIIEFIEGITHTYSFTSKDVFQFSKLDDAITKLCNILEYDYPSLTILEAGRLLTHAKGDYACIKYGENHAKTAEMLSLVRFERPIQKKGRVIKITSLGSVTTAMSPENKIELIKRLAIRNKTEKALIYEAKQQDVFYDDFISQALSGQTIIRRRTNVKQITSLVLKDNKLYERIVWY